MGLCPDKWHTTEAIFHTVHFALKSFEQLTGRASYGTVSRQMTHDGGYLSYPLLCMALEFEKFKGGF